MASHPAILPARSIMDQSGPAMPSRSSNILSQVHPYFEPGPALFWARSSIILSQVQSGPVRSIQVQTWPASHICAYAFVQPCIALSCHVSNGHLARFAQQVQLARSKSGMIIFSHVQSCPVMATYVVPCQPCLACPAKSSQPPSQPQPYLASQPGLACNVLFHPFVI